jgi:hypothetical protein
MMLVAVCYFLAYSLILKKEEAPYPRNVCKLLPDCTASHLECSTVHGHRCESRKPKETSASGS